MSEERSGASLKSGSGRRFGRPASTLAFISAWPAGHRDPGGFDYTISDCMGWLREAGFTDLRAEHLAGPDSMVTGRKA